MSQIKESDIDRIDDSMMPSAEERAKFRPLPEELEKKLDEDIDKIAHELGLY